MLIIDRFEGDFAVVETGAGMVNLPKADLPADAKEGDVLTISIDNSKTADRGKQIKDKMNRLFK